jgi:hypothetical protein
MEGVVEGLTFPRKPVLDASRECACVASGSRQSRTRSKPQAGTGGWPRPSGVRPPTCRSPRTVSRSRSRTLSTIFRADGINPMMTSSATVRLAIHENLVLAIASRDRIHLDPELTAEARRHPDGVYSRDSERAITNRYSCHGILPGLSCDEGKVSRAAMDEQEEASAPRR